MNNNERINSPIFFIGMPRSGTTIVFEAFARHSELGWLTNYSHLYPSLPWVNAIKRLHVNPFVRVHAMKKQYDGVNFFNKFMVRPDEAYNFWDKHAEIDFSRGPLTGMLAEQPAAKRIRRKIVQTMRAQGGRRFATKLTGPGRISYLKSVFPDARFIHVVRDGRAVIHSLLNVPFWRQKGGFDGPFWDNVLSDDLVAFWEQSDRDPAVIAALQWNSIVRGIQEEVLETEAAMFTLRYEDYVDSPHRSFEEMNSFCELAECACVREYLKQHVKLVNMNNKYLQEWPQEKIALLTDIMSDSLKLHGYQHD